MVPENVCQLLLGIAFVYAPCGFMGDTTIEDAGTRTLFSIGTGRRQQPPPPNRPNERDGGGLAFRAYGN